MNGNELLSMWNLAAQAVVSAVVSVLLYALHRSYDRGHLRYWAWSWLALCVSAISSAAAVWTSPALPDREALHFVTSLLGSLGGYFQAAWLVLGAVQLASGRDVPRRWLRSVPPVVVSVALATTLAFAGDPTQSAPRHFTRLGVRGLLCGLAYVGSGILLLRRRRVHGLGRPVVSAGLFVYGGQQLHYGVVLAALLCGVAPPAYLSYMGLVDLVLQMALGLAMVTGLLEEERGLALALAADKRRAESARAETALFASEVVTSASAGIIALDHDMRYLMWNPFMEQLTGLPEEAVVGKKGMDLFPHLRKYGIDEMFRRALSGETLTSEPMYFEIPLSGHSGWVISTYGPRRDGNGTITGVTALVRDISEQKRAEQARKDSEERYRFLFENNPQPMWVYDTRTLSFLAVNDAALALYGYARDEFLRLGLWDIVRAWDPEGPPPRGSDVLRRIADLPDYVSYGETYKHRRKDGTLIEVEVASHRLDFGEWPSRVLMVRDVTDRTRVEAERGRLQRALLSAAAEWKGTFDGIDSLVVLLDAKGRVTRLNRAALQLRGGHWDDNLGVPLLGLGPGEPWQSAAGLAAAVRRQGGSRSLSIKDAHSGRAWTISASRLEATEVGEERTVVVAREITEFVRLEESLRRKETMSAMGSLVAGVAHEVRNPLFGISSTLDAFEARFGRGEQFQRYLTTLRGQVDRLGELMNDLLEYGRPLAAELHPVKLDELIAQAVEACETLARGHKVSLSAAAEPELPVALADRKRLIQVFENVVDNAIRHSLAGGVVRVTADVVVDSGERWVRCSVRDSGSGFDPEDLARAVEPFFTKRRGGTGLGLSIVQRIVDQHGGRLHIGNHPQGGALVTVTLRAVDELRAAAGYSTA